MEINHSFWNGRSVFLTGHTGFKGGWLALWLTMLGAKVHGYSLDAPTTPNFFTATNLREKLTSSSIANINNFSALFYDTKTCLSCIEIVFKHFNNTVLQNFSENNLY